MAEFMELIARGTNIPNSTVDIENCTLKTCPLEWANQDYVPNLFGNILYLALFAFVLIAQVFLGIRHRTWGFLVGMIGGCGLEIAGYIGRIQMHYNPFPSDPFLLYLVCLTIAPAFMTAAIYLCLGRIVVAYGAEISRIKPGTYTIIFVSCDFLSLLLQAAGGAMATSSDHDSAQTGINIMIAGLVFQVISLFVFSTLCIEFALQVRKHPAATDSRFAGLRSSFKFRAFQWSLAIAVFTIFIRSVYRVAELKGGFGGKIANDQTAFMILEGPMIIIAVGLLTIYHPGASFAGQWQSCTWSFRTKKSAKLPEEYSESLRMEERGRYSNA